jgi:hypothetical protein
MPSTIALVKAPLPQALLSADNCRPREAAYTTMPPFSAEVTVLTRTLISTGGRLPALPAWQGSRLNR